MTEFKEERTYTVVHEVSEMGRSRITIVCPFCGEHVVAYRWSLAGSGKRCGCGALFDRFARAVKWEVTKE